MNPLSLISGAFQAVANYFGWAKERQALNNSPEMIETLEAKRRQELHEKHVKEVRDNILPEIRKDGSE